MSNPWDEFAKQDVMYYIDTSRSDYQESTTGDQAQAAFFAKGEEIADRILKATSPWRTGGDVAIEIGCGVGRIAIPMARKFRTVRVVDVSPTTLGFLKENCRKRGIENIETYLPHEAWDEGIEADLIYSWQVFRHIESYDIITDYVRRSGGCLSGAGCGCFMFETRPATLAYKLRTLVPDALLPRQWKRNIRGCRRSPQLVRKTLAESGLRVSEELAPATRQHIFLVQSATKEAKALSGSAS